MPKDTFFNLPEEKRMKIIDAAVGEFSKVHYKKVTIDNIVQRAEISKGSFYQYFSDKDDLYKHVFDQIGNQKKQALEDVQKYTEQLGFRDYLIKMLTEAEMHDAELIELKDKFINECPQEVRKEVLKNEIPKSNRLLEEVIACYIKKGELRKDLNVKIVAYMVTSCFTSLEFFELGKGENIRDVVIQILDVLIDGLK